MRYEFHPEALEEYEAAALWYAERDPELAERFVHSVEEAIGRILEAPDRWRIIDQDVRRCLTRVFPYGILYTIEADFAHSCGYAWQPEAWLLERPNRAIGIVAIKNIPGPGSSDRQCGAQDSLVLFDRASFDYSVVDSVGISEGLGAAEPRLGRRTALTFALFPPPQKNWSPPSDSSPDTSIPAGISRVSRTSPDSGSIRLNSLSLSSNVPCQSSPSTHVTPVTKRLDSMVRRIAPVSGST